MALNTTKLGLSGVNALFKMYYGRDATKPELDYWANKSDAELRPKLIPNSAVQLAKNKPATSAATSAPAKPPTSTVNPVTTPAKTSPTPANLNTSKLGLSGVNALFKMYYGRDATKPELDYWANKSDAELRPKLIPNSQRELSRNQPKTQESVGKPFSVEDQQKALSDSIEEYKLYYEAMQEKDKADTEASLAKDQADYQDYLINSGQQFESDKTQADQQSADSGVLFSGGRVQRERNLERAYQQDQASNLRKATDNIGQAASAYQYKYGNEGANALNKYYNLGSNTFNASKATGGAGSGSLSSVYDPNKFTFQGTQNTERLADANTRAAGKLWNKGNKLLATGYNNQY